MIKYKKNNINLMIELGVNNVNSATDCTGLIPFAPSNDDEYNSYDRIINFRASDADSKKAK